MQTRSKIFDDISQLMTNAMGVAPGAKGEAETAMSNMIDRWLAERDFVTREEFDADPHIWITATKDAAGLRPLVEAALEALD